jgi:acetyl-CoA carboxylase biotin carboxyl carrier protein
VEREMTGAIQALASSEVLTASEASTVSMMDAAFNAGDDAGKQVVSDNVLVDVKSPLVGVYYAAPSPDAETFVSIGSNVKKGDVLCIIETMKLMNEIIAEQDGEIIDICIKNGEIAEFGQVLFKMR